MAKYNIQFKKSVSRDLRKIPNKDIKRILERIDGLVDDPRPPGSEKLSGDEKYRIRQGNNSNLYLIEDTIITVTIIKIGHRREVYR